MCFLPEIDHFYRNQMSKFLSQKYLIFSGNGVVERGKGLLAISLNFSLNKIPNYCW